MESLRKVMADPRRILESCRCVVLSREEELAELWKLDTWELGLVLNGGFDDATFFGGLRAPSL